MRESIRLNNWSVIRFSRDSETFFFVLTGVDEHAAGICSSRIVSLKGSNVPDFPYEETDNIIPFRLPQLICRDDGGVTYKLLAKAPTGGNPWPALVALIQWCGNRYKLGDFGLSSIAAMKDSLHAIKSIE